MTMFLTACAAIGTAAGCALVRRYLDRTSRREREWGGGRVRFTTLWNHGGAFGLPLRGRPLMALSAAALAGLLPMARRSRLGVGLLLGGGLSNLWERVRHGRVYDYMQFPKAPGPLRRYVFNLADAAILAGGVLVLLGRAKERKGRS